MAATKLLLLLLGLHLALANESKPIFQFTEISHAIVGSFMKPIDVESFTECGHRAFGRNALGFKMVVAEKDDEFGLCHIAEQVDHFAEITEENSYFFFADLRNLKDMKCRATSENDIMIDFVEIEFCHIKLKDVFAEDRKFCDKFSALSNVCMTSPYVQEVNPNCYKLPTSPTTTTTATEKPEMPCPGNWTLQEDNIHCCFDTFYFPAAFQKCIGWTEFGKYNDVRTQDEMYAECEKYGGVAVSIENKAQNNELTTKFASYKMETKLFVIGYQIPEKTPWSEDAFQWINGSSSLYRGWFTTPQPEERITVLLVNGTWKSITFDEARDVQLMACMLNAVVAAKIE